MKKIIVVLFLVFAIAKNHAQNYQISFAGTGASTNVDSVEVENLTQCNKILLGGNDILHLTATSRISGFMTNQNNSINIYPNPMSGNCYVDFIASSQGKANIEIFDITGKRIIHLQEYLSKGLHIYRLDGINSGIYTLKIESERYSYSTKIVSTNSILGTAELKHIEDASDINEQIPALNTAKPMHLKNCKSAIYMQYSTGDILKITGKSGIYRTIFMLVPTNNQTVTFNFIACTDADGNNYSIVQIDTMIWMAENLKTTRYRNGSTIPNVTNDNTWDNLTTGAYCNYNNTTNSASINTYGRLYNWYAVNDNSNIAPQGWHVASDAEWNSLKTYLGGGSIAGGKMKEKCTTLWNSPNIGATNETGFTALPGGYRGYSGAFYYIGEYETWWSSTQTDPSNAGTRYLYNGDAYLYSYPFLKTNGFSVRCVKD